MSSPTRRPDARRRICAGRSPACHPWRVSNDDPGWKPAWRGLIIGILPWLLRGLATSGRLGNPLVTMRTVFMACSMQLVGFGVVIFWLDATSSASAHSASLALALVAAGGAISLLGRRLEKPLEGTSDVTLASSYRSRFFLRVAFAEVAALAGFIAFFETYQWWAFPAGALFTVIGLRRAAPTTARLARDQERLTAVHCEHRLVDALLLPPVS